MSVLTAQILLSALFLTVSGLASLFPLGILEQQPKLTGTAIPLSRPAPDFTLTDQHGLSFHMADTRGKVVVSTFIYTHCSDVCPLIAMKLKSAHDQLGNGTAKTVFVAVISDN